MNSSSPKTQKPLTFKFFFPTSKGLEETALKEITELGISVDKKKAIQNGGIALKVTFEDAFRISIWSRCISRAWLRIDYFEFDHESEIPEKISKARVRDYLDKRDTFLIKNKIDHRVMKEFKNSYFINQVVKDGVVGCFHRGEAPKVEKENPTTQFYFHISPANSRNKKFQGELFVDFVGFSLFMRGYREKGFEAPMRENLAAGIVLASLNETQKDFTTFYDPMCGSGTLIIECFLLKNKISPQVLNLKKSHSWSCFKFPVTKDNHDLLDNFRNQIAEALEFEISDDFNWFASDLQGKSGSALRRFLSKLSLDYERITFEKLDFLEATPLAESCFLLMNPPYAIRMGEEEEVEKLYYEIGETIKNKFKESRAMIFTSNPDLRKQIQLKTTKRIPVRNGKIESRIFLYDLY
ncbi:MAG: THUMP domain-containing class I SAM-dependent RNA methyltransferase [Bacteriovoracaceae bacterium]